MRDRLFSTALLGLVAALPLTAAAQSYPAKPIRVIVPFGAGTSTDIMTRMVTTRMSQSLGQQFVVENRAGAGGTIGSLAVKRHRVGPP